LVAKPWENVFNGLTFGLGLVTATALFNYFTKLAGEQNFLNLPTSGRNYADGDDQYFTNYSYTEPIHEPPTGTEKLVYGDELYSPGFSYYAYDYMGSMTQVPAEADLNTIPALVNPNV